MNDTSKPFPDIVMLPGSTIETMLEEISSLSKKLDKLVSTKSGDEYLTAQEFMERTKMCRATFDDLRNKNIIEVIKRGRKLYLRADAVQKYIEGK